MLLPPIDKPWWALLCLLALVFATVSGAWYVASLDRPDKNENNQRGGIGQNASHPFEQIVVGEPKVELWRRFGEPISDAAIVRGGLGYGIWHDPDRKVSMIVKLEEFQVIDAIVIYEDQSSKQDLELICRYWQQEPDEIHEHPAFEGKRIKRLFR